MMAIGGGVRGGLYGTAAERSTPTPDNPTLENNGGDVRYETDFRSVYAKVIDSWLGATRRDPGRGFPGRSSELSMRCQIPELQVSNSRLHLPTPNFQASVIESLL